MLNYSHYDWAHMETNAGAQLENLNAWGFLSQNFDNQRGIKNQRKAN